MTFNSRRSRPGFTLLELLIVLAVIGMLTAIVAPQMIRYLGSSRTQTADVQVDNIDAAIKLFQIDVGRYPTDEEGLAALVKAPAGLSSWNGPYLERTAALNDPWGAPYQLRSPGRHSEFDVFTLGSDGVEGGTREAQDVGNW